MTDNAFEPRMERYQDLNSMKAIVKNARSRCACFWLDVANLSGTGLGIVYTGRGHVPFAVGDDLHMTIDTSCMIFRRPIHITVNVRWREEDEITGLQSGLHKTFMGCQITLIDPIHILVWNEGLEKLAATQKQDPSLLMPLALVANG